MSFDIVSLFPSVPKEKAVELAEEVLTQSQAPQNIVKELMDLVILCVNQNYFVFNGNHYQQDNGLAIGSPLSPLLAELFMNNLEKELFQCNHTLMKNVHYWYRYVDDILCLWNGTKRQVRNFLKMLNTLNESIKFTVEFQDNDRINFLDLKISIQNGKHMFGIYRKPTCTDHVIHANSKHPPSQKLAAFRSMVHRAIVIPLTNEEYCKEINIIKSIATANGFKEAMIDNMIAKKKKEISLRQIYSIEPVKAERWRKINYIGSASLRVGKFLNHLGIKPAFHNKKNLKYLLTSVKDAVDIKDQSGIYRLKCGDCVASYIGQTGRSLKARAEEHKRDFEKKEGKSQFSAHLLEDGHRADFIPEMLQRVNKGTKMDIWEQFYIVSAVSRKEIITNDHVFPFHSPLLDLPQLMGKKTLQAPENSHHPPLPYLTPDQRSV